jgi:Nitrous oxide-stimulated promoter
MSRRRVARERRTIAAMIALYCRHHHGGRRPCAACAALDAYAGRRLERCVFGPAKPTCANCTVHCYRREEREAIRTVMRWAGPRMLRRHPVLALAHLLDGKRAAPALPRRRDAARA